MKRLISAAILFVFVIAAYSVSLWYITDACKETKTLIDECEEAYKNGGDAYDKAEELKRLWDKKEGPLSFFCNARQHRRNRACYKRALRLQQGRGRKRF